MIDVYVLFKQAFSSLKLPDIPHLLFLLKMYMYIQILVYADTKSFVNFTMTSKTAKKVCFLRFHNEQIIYSSHFLFMLSAYISPFVFLHFLLFLFFVLLTLPLTFFLSFPIYPYIHPYAHPHTPIITSPFLPVIITPIILS